MSALSILVMQEKDLIIIGAGPAGLTAGIYGVRAELDVLVLEAVFPGGQIATAGEVENYPGFPDGIKGIHLADQMRSHAEKAGVTFKSPEPVKRLERDGDGFVITTDSEQYAAKAVIIATGLTHKKLGIPGEKEFAGRGVSYCATCDGPLFKGRRVIVLGSGTGAVMAALNLSDIAGKILLVMRRERPTIAEKIMETRLSKSKVKIVPKTKVLEVLGEEFVTGLKVMDPATEEERIIDADGIFVEVGKLPNTELLEGMDVEIDKKGYVVVDEDQCTSVPGLYAAGDVTNCKVKQVGVAVAQGTIAAIAAYDYIKSK